MGTYVHSTEWVRCKQNDMRAYVHRIRKRFKGWMVTGYTGRVAETGVRKRGKGRGTQVGCTQDGQRNAE